MASVTSLSVPNSGLVIRHSGSYVISNNPSFDGVDSPLECLHPVSKVATCGILILASDVQLNLGGHHVGLSPSSASLLREFSCLVVRGNRVSIFGGTVGRASSCCIECTGSDLDLQGLSLRDFETGGALISNSQGHTRVCKCSIGPSFKGRRPSAELSLSASYLPTLSTFAEGNALAAHLTLGTSRGPLRSDRGTIFGVAILQGPLSSGLTVQTKNSVNSTNSRNSINPNKLQSRIRQRQVNNNSHTECSATVESVTMIGIITIAELSDFLSYSLEEIPKGAFGDAIPHNGASQVRVAAHAAATLLTGLPPPDSQLSIPRAQQKPFACSTTATNFGTCSSCSYPSQLQVIPPKRAKLFKGYDAHAEKPLGAHGLWIQGRSTYTVSDVTVEGLNASIRPNVENSPFPDIDVISGGKLGTSNFTLVSCGCGKVNSVPDPTLISSTRPEGLPLRLPPGFSGAWVTGGGGFSNSRPVGNIQNIQIRNAVLAPSYNCSGSPG
jgi:hypothetical protein